MLIFEGCEFSGRNDYARAFSTYLDLCYQRIEVHSSLTWNEIDYFELASKRCVYDGFHLQEVVASKVHKTNCRIKNPRFLHSSLTVRYAALTVIVTVDPDLIELRHNELGMPDDKILKFALEENALFRKIAPYYSDFHIHETAAMQYASDQDIAEIQKRYVERNECFNTWKTILKGGK